MQSDHGPIYAETNYDQWIKEPFNAGSALIFAIIAIYWLVRLRGQYRNYIFFSVSMLILLVGGIGGTLFHAFRSHRIFLLMDVLPILILCIAVSLYFWRKIFSRTIYLAIPPLLFFAIVSSARSLIPTRAAINLQYALLALLILTPIVLIQIKTKFKHASWVISAFACFSIALFCRFFDLQSPLPMGTHWLWHSFASVSVIFLIRYLYTFETRVKV